MTKRLFFPAASADAVVDCLVSVQPKTEIVKGRLEDIWDTGWDGDVLIALILALCVLHLIGWLWITIEAFRTSVLSGFLVLLSPLVPIYIFFYAIFRLDTPAKWFVILLYAGSLFGILTLLGLIALGIEFSAGFSFVLVTVATLLGFEWLCRKLLRLA